MKGSAPREGRTWPAYVLGGRLRTSTAVLLIAFCAVWWLYETYEPGAATPEQIPATEVVPPGFIPDPAYTWAPRTDVQRRSETETTTSTTPTSTTPTSPTSPTPSAEPGVPPTSSASTSSAPSSTVPAEPTTTPHTPQPSSTPPAPAAGGAGAPVPPAQ